MPEICVDFQRAHGCSRGHDCRRFHKDQHGHIVQVTQAKEVTDLDKQASRWQNCLPELSSDQLGGQYLIKMFKEATELVESGDAGALQAVVTGLCGERGLLVVKLLVVIAEYDTWLQSFKVEAFCKVLIPFLKIIGHERALGDVTCRDVKGALPSMWEFIYGDEGHNGAQAIAFFDKMIAMTEVYHAHYREIAGPLPRDDTYVAPFEAVITVLSQVLHHHKWIAKDVPGWSKTLSDLDEIVNTFGRDSATAARAKRTLFKAKALLEPQAAAPGAYEMASKNPGLEVAPPGGRHSNDVADIAKIGILPTPSELSFQGQEYLPTRDPATHHLLGLPGYLNFLFRLGRKDSVGMLTQAVKEERARVHAIRTRSANLSWSEAVDSNDRPASAQRIAYNNLRTLHVGFNQRPGHKDKHGLNRFEVHIEIDQPDFIHGTTSNLQRQALWGDSKRLRNGAVVCLLGPNKLAVWATMGETRDVPKWERLPQCKGLFSDPDRASVKVKLLVADDANLEMLIPGRAIEGAMSLVEFPGQKLLAFQPTLLAVQEFYQTQADIPFKSLFLPISQTDASQREEFTQPPAYCTPGFRFNLSSSTLPGVTQSADDSILGDSEAERLHFDPFNLNSVDPKVLSERSNLDIYQSEALLHALSNRVALVEGGPGTGKTHLALDLVACLLGSRPDKKVLVVHYNEITGRQLATGLLNSGIRVVKEGGKIEEHDELADITMASVTKDVGETTVEGALYYKYTAIKKKVASDIEVYLRTFCNSETSEGLEEYLRDNSPQYREAIFGRKHLKGGFQTALPKETYDQAFKSWKTSGQDLDGQVSRPVAELRQADPWTMSSHERIQLAATWIGEIRTKAWNALKGCMELYEAAHRDLDSVQTGRDLRSIEEKDTQVLVIAASHLASNFRLIQSLAPGALVIVEGNQIVEQQSILAFAPSIEHAIIMGDSQQLRPQVQDKGLEPGSRSERGAAYAWNVSLLERLSRGMFDGQHLKAHRLKMQHRMHPDLAALFRPHVPDLEDDPSLASLCKAIGVDTRIYWLNHSKREESLEDHAIATSIFNPYEAEVAAALSFHLLAQGDLKTGHLGVLTPYIRNMQKIRDACEVIFPPGLDRWTIEAILEAMEDKVQRDDTDVMVEKRSLLDLIQLFTGDGAAGRDFKVCIVLGTRSNEKQDIGFVGAPQRFLTLVSRAQNAIFFVGDEATFAGGSSEFHKLIEHLKSEDRLSSYLPFTCPRHLGEPMRLSDAASFKRLSPEGGCNRRCGKPLDCGHMCPGFCHAEFMHRADRCDVLIDEVTLPCGHVEQSLPCWKAQTPNNIKCKRMVERTLPGCNHIVTTECHVDVNRRSFVCEQSCGKMLPCGHLCPKTCKDCFPRGFDVLGPHMPGPCQSSCGSGQAGCKHPCAAPCHGSNGCPACTIRCERSCPHGECQRACGRICTPCQEASCVRTRDIVANVSHQIGELSLQVAEIEINLLSTGSALLSEDTFNPWATSGVSGDMVLRGTNLRPLQGYAPIRPIVEINSLQVRYADLARTINSLIDLDRLLDQNSKTFSALWQEESEKGPIQQEKLDEVLSGVKLHFGLQMRARSILHTANLLLVSDFHAIVRRRPPPFVLTMDLSTALKAVAEVVGDAGRLGMTRTLADSHVTMAKLLALQSKDIPTSTWTLQLDKDGKAVSNPQELRASACKYLDFVDDIIQNASGSVNEGLVADVVSATGMIEGDDDLTSMDDLKEKVARLRNMRDMQKGPAHWKRCSRGHPYRQAHEEMCASSAEGSEKILRWEDRVSSACEEEQE